MRGSAAMPSSNSSWIPASQWQAILEAIPSRGGGMIVAEQQLLAHTYMGATSVFEWGMGDAP